MKRSKRLSPVMEIAAKDTEAALAKVGQANSAWLNEKQQLEDLHRYKGEYLAKFRQGDSLTMSAQKVLELRGFLSQLDQAINAQQQQVSLRLTQLEQQRALWQQVRIKEQAMQTLVERYQIEEQQLELKKEQNESDERNTSQWQRRSR
jgi:flagellar FliJ protein